MSDLHLYALSINEVRDLVGAEPAHAARLREQVRPLLTEPVVAPRGWSRLFARGPRPDPGQPTEADVEAVLSGRWAPPERAVNTWRALELLIRIRALGSCALPLAPDGIEGFDFAVTRAGAPANAGLGTVLRAGSRIGLPPNPAVVTGYLPYAQAQLMAQGLTGIRLEDAGHRAVLGTLVGFLATFPRWAGEAATAGRPQPDLLAIWTLG
ncbi:DUF7691 family protein [Granulicoccus phenolivorans]|uniref:DUF7691 family protein n=1 Tax=Granulicoccus phenolivorans TaxID=266854 RepID=UPI00042834EF|nr:hypothetical protein [Granulicoccus phenolivorans]